MMKKIMRQAKGKGEYRASRRMDELSDRPIFGGEYPFRIAFAVYLPGCCQAFDETGGPDDSAAESGEKPAPFYSLRRQIRPFVFDGADRGRQYWNPSHLFGDCAGRCGSGGFSGSAGFAGKACRRADGACRQTFCGG